MPIIGNLSSGGKKPTTPTIGTATDAGTGTSVNVAFTASSYIGKGTITYTATSTPGSLTATGSGSPLTVTGLTTGTAYTFTVRGNTNYGVASDNSAASNSVTPASPSSYESIATISPSTGTKTITFSSIPSSYKSLQIRAIARTDTGGSGNDAIFMRINGDTGSNYSTHRLDADGTNVGAVGFANQAYNVYGYAPNNGALASTFSGQIIDLIDYASTTKNKTTRFFSGINVNSASNTQLQLSSGLWNSTAAVTSISFTVANYNFQSGTTFALYGIK